MTVLLALLRLFCADVAPVAVLGPPILIMLVPVFLIGVGIALYRVITKKNEKKNESEDEKK